MPEIPRPNGSGPRTRADIDESSSSTPVTGEPLPQKAPPPGARSRKPGKLRLISLIVIPIVAAAAAAYFNPPQYGGGASLKIVEAGPPAASASNRKARYDVVEFTRSLFLSAAWSEAHHREEGAPDFTVAEADDEVIGADAELAHRVDGERDEFGGGGR